MTQWDIDRRRFLSALGVGAAAALAPHAAGAALATRPRSVVIIGAGIGGLVAAYELQKQGVEVTVLEARDRVGGIVWTVRDGDRISHIGEEDQVARFAEGNYVDAGAGRIPSHHENLLNLTRELKVPLEIYVHESRGNYLFHADGRGGKGGMGRIRLRQAVNDLRGRFSELLDKAVRSGSLDQEIPADLRGKLTQFLKLYGDLGEDGRYAGSVRSGFARRPGATFAEQGVAIPPLTLDDLIANTQLATVLYEEEIWMQPTMLHPVGGMDRIPHALAGALRTPVRLNAEVRQIRRKGKGVAIVYHDRLHGREEMVTADHAIINAPLPVLAKIANDFSPAIRKAISSTTYSDAMKVAFESTPFWEKEHIYGGNSYVDDDTGVIWYPSGSFQKERQILIGAYAWDDLAERLGKNSRAHQIEIARGVVERMHPGHGKDLTNPVVIDWRRIPFSEGPWVGWHSHGNSIANAATLNAGDGPFTFVGSYLSAYSGEWQEGAVLSARRAVGKLTGRPA